MTLRYVDHRIRDDRDHLENSCRSESGSPIIQARSHNDPMNPSSIEPRYDRRYTTLVLELGLDGPESHTTPHIGISTYLIIRPVRPSTPVRLCADHRTETHDALVRLVGRTGFRTIAKQRSSRSELRFCTQSVLFLQWAYRTSIDLVRDERCTVRYDYGSAIAVMHEETSMAHGIQHCRPAGEDPGIVFDDRMVSNSRMKS